MARITVDAGMIRYKITKLTCAAGVLFAVLLTGCAGNGETAVNEKQDGIQEQADAAIGQENTGDRLTITNYHFLISDAFLEAFHEK